MRGKRRLAHGQRHAVVAQVGHRHLLALAAQRLVAGQDRVRGVGPRQRHAGDAAGFKVGQGRAHISAAAPLVSEPTARLQPKLAKQSNYSSSTKDRHSFFHGTIQHNVIMQQ